MEPLLLTAERLAALFGISERQHQEKEKAGEPGYPMPIWLGPRTKRYKYSDALAYVDGLVAKTSPTPEPAQLQAKRKAAAQRLAA